MTNIYAWNVISVSVSEQKEKNYKIKYKTRQQISFWNERKKIVVEIETVAVNTFYKQMLLYIIHLININKKKYCFKLVLLLKQ